MNTMSIRIYNRRKEMGFTMQELADKVGVTKSTINKWEKGHIENVKRQSIVELAKALNCDPVWIMGIDVNKTIQDEALDVLVRFKSQTDKDYYNKIAKILENSEKRKFLATVIDGLAAD